ncbi:MAG: aminotransferase class V-fold PLP-dependent enzyme, partial [Clostridia bacterium]|nr:aminotransferase class V-fold PLP-dependent enzyme [Clostridia bacterium]
MIYLDNAATTPPLEKAVDYAKKYIGEFYNPSALYSEGLEVSRFLKQVREKLVSYICPKGYECIFTSGGSESDNTAIFSSARRGNAVTTAGEHSAVYEAVKSLEGKGVECRYAALNSDGSVCVADLLNKIDEKTVFVSVVHINNETGAINDINYIASEVKKKNPRVIFHSDGVQAYGKIPYRMSNAVDFYSASAHKIGALKGCGILFKSPRVALHPLIYGGGQEGGYRSGTENVFGIAALHKASELKFSDITANFKRVYVLKKRF